MSKKQRWLCAQLIACGAILFVIGGTQWASWTFNHVGQSDSDIAFIALVEFAGFWLNALLNPRARRSEND